MTIEVAALISGLSLAFAVYFGISNLKRNQKSDNQKEASEMTTVIVKLEDISAGIAEIKTEFGVLKSEQKEIRDRVIVVEQSVKSAWKRIEAQERTIRDVEKMNISSGTIARTIILALALVNQILVVCGVNPLPIEDGQIELLVSTTWTVLAGVWAWWKNNSWTKRAIQADEYLDGLRK